MLVPDYVHGPGMVVESALPVADGEPDTLPVDGPDLTQLKGLIVRVKNVLIRNNHRGSLLGGNPKADVYPVILVVTGTEDPPVQFSLPGVYNGIQDNEELPIPENGLTVHRSLEVVPPFLDVHVLLMRSLKAQRDFTTALQKTMGSTQGQSVLGALRTVAGAPGALGGMALNMGATLLEILIGHLSERKDKQIFYAAGSFEREPERFGIGKTHVFEDEDNARVELEITAVTA